MSELSYVEPSLKPKRIFVDASFTLTSGKNTGIERVVRNILAESSHVSDIPITVMFAYGNQFYSIEPEQESLLSKPKNFQANAIAHLPLWYSQMASTICRALPARVLKKWLMPHAGHLGVFKIPHVGFDTYCRHKAAANGQLLMPNSGDLVLLPDAYWTEEQVWGAAKKARQRGAFVASLVYDLIPMMYPEYVGERRRASFIEYFRDLATHSDLIVTISDTVRREVEEQLPQVCNGREYCRDVRAITLGAELAEVQGSVRDKVQEVFVESGGDNPYIMVGSFDPRKNHTFLLDAFERLWQSGSQRRLCFIGRVGALNRDVVDRIYAHGEFGKKLIVFHDLTDCELQFCYRYARGVLMASKVEGFGLPIVEALWHGKKTFVSNTAIHREVGGEFCDFFDLDDPANLTELILAWEEELRDGASMNPVKYRPVSWRESVAMLFDTCLAEFAKEASAAGKVEYAA